MDYEFMNTILIDLTRANSKFKIIFSFILNFFAIIITIFIIFKIN